MNTQYSIYMRARLRIIENYVCFFACLLFFLLFAFKHLPVPGQASLRSGAREKRAAVPEPCPVPQALVCQRQLRLAHAARSVVPLLWGVVPRQNVALGGGFAGRAAPARVWQRQRALGEGGAVCGPAASGVRRQIAEAGADSAQSDGTKRTLSLSFKPLSLFPRS